MAMDKNYGWMLPGMHREWPPNGHESSPLTGVMHFAPRPVYVCVCDWWQRLSNTVLFQQLRNEYFTNLKLAHKLQITY